MLLDFVNQKKSKNSGYLSVSIPEAFIEELQKTKSFEVLSRDLSKKVTRKKHISPENLFSDDNAILIGKASGADVVVIGNFIAIGSDIQIQAKAVDVFSGRVKVSHSVLGKIDSSIFKTIKKLVKAISRDMKQKLPPLSQKVIIRERIIVKEKSEKQDDPKTFAYDFHIMGTYNIPVATVADYIQNGFGFRLDGSKQILWPWFHAFVQTGYNTNSVKNKNRQTQVGYIQAGMLYPFEVLNSLVVKPYFSSGATMGKITSFFIQPSVDTGMIIDYFITRRIAFSIATSVSYLFDNNLNPLLFNLYSGVGIRF